MEKKILDRFFKKENLGLKPKSSNLSTNTDVTVDENASAEIVEHFKSVEAEEKTVYWVEDHENGVVLYNAHYLNQTGFPQLDIFFHIISNQNLDRMLNGRSNNLPAKKLYQLAMKKLPLVDSTNVIQIDTTANSVEFPFNVIINNKDYSWAFYSCEEKIMSVANQLLGFAEPENFAIKERADEINSKITDIVGQSLAVDDNI